MLFDSEVRRNNYVQSLHLVRNLGFANWIRCTLFKPIIAMCVQPGWMRRAGFVKIKETTNKGIETHPSDTFIFISLKLLCGHFSQLLSLLLLISYLF